MHSRCVTAVHRRCAQRPAAGHHPARGLEHPQRGRRAGLGRPPAVCRDRALRRADDCAWWRSMPAAVRCAPCWKSRRRAPAAQPVFLQPCLGCDPAGQDTAVWFSQRDGWGHLYRVRLSDGKVMRQLTRGRWAVRDLLGVDSAGAWAYFSAGGVEGGDPYVRGLYRVALHGGPVQRLAADGSDHLADAGTGMLFGGRARRHVARRQLSGGYRVQPRAAAAQCCAPAMAAK